MFFPARFPRGAARWQVSFNFYANRGTHDTWTIVFLIAAADNEWRIKYLPTYYPSISYCFRQPLLVSLNRLIIALPIQVEQSIDWAKWTDPARGSLSIYIHYYVTIDSHIFREISKNYLLLLNSLSAALEHRIKRLKFRWLRLVASRRLPRSLRSFAWLVWTHWPPDIQLLDGDTFLKDNPIHGSVVVRLIHK